MQNEKGYNICGVGNNIRSTKTCQAIKMGKLRELKPGQKMFITSKSVYESSSGRLIDYARDLGRDGGFSIGPDTGTDYSYLLKNLPEQTQLFIRRNR